MLSCNGQKNKDLTIHTVNLNRITHNIVTWYMYIPTFKLHTVKLVYNGLYQKDQILVFKTNYRLMQVERIAECSKGSILQYFRSSSSYNLSLDMWFPTMWYFDKCELRRVYTASC